MNYKEEIIRYRLERAEETYLFPSVKFRDVIHNLGGCQIGYRDLVFRQGSLQILIVYSLCYHHQQIGLHFRMLFCK